MICNELQFTPDNSIQPSKEIEKSLNYREFEANIPGNKEINKWMGRYCNIIKQQSV